MAESFVSRKRKIEGRTKVKTGCATCRIRKVKCDETKPFCKKCVNTGRACDGYESPFRFFASQPIDHVHTGAINSAVYSHPIQVNSDRITPQDVERLSRYFSTKTIFDVKLNCDEEARQILQASLTDPSIWHAVSSLKALREDLEEFGDDPEEVKQLTSGHNYGIQQYCMALGGLASNLSSPSSNELKSALICCQIFISIEQVRKNYAAMAQHIIRGLNIMHEYRTRPNLVSANKLIPAHHADLSLLDVFIIKLFIAPCKFADPPADSHQPTLPTCSTLSLQQHVDTCNLRVIAPDKRTELTKIATSTLAFLSRVSQVKTLTIALDLLSEKEALLISLNSWLINFELLQKELGPSSNESISDSFLRLFHLVLKIVVLGALNSSSDLYAELQSGKDRLQAVANSIADKVKFYRTCNGTGSDRGKSFTMN